MSVEGMGDPALAVVEGSSTATVLETYEVGEVLAPTLRKGQKRSW